MISWEEARRVDPDAAAFTLAALAGYWFTVWGRAWRQARRKGWA